MSAPSPGFELDDVLAWIEASLNHAMGSTPHAPTGQNFLHQFIAAIACAIPEVSIHTASAQIQGRAFDGAWSALPFLGEQFHIPRFADQWLFHGGVASEELLGVVMGKKLDRTLAQVIKRGEYAPGDLRVGPIEFHEDADAREHLRGKMVANLLASSAGRVMAGYRERHLQARALDTITPRNTAPSRPARRM